MKGKKISHIYRSEIQKRREKNNICTSSVHYFSSLVLINRALILVINQHQSGMDSDIKTKPAQDLLKIKSSPLRSIRLQSMQGFLLSAEVLLQMHVILGVFLTV